MNANSIGACHSTHRSLRGCKDACRSRPSRSPAATNCAGARPPRGTASNARRGRGWGQRRRAGSRAAAAVRPSSGQPSPAVLPGFHAARGGDVDGGVVGPRAGGPRDPRTVRPSRNSRWHRTGRRGSAPMPAKRLEGPRVAHMRRDGRLILEEIRCASAAYLADPGAGPPISSPPAIGRGTPAGTSLTRNRGRQFQIEHVSSVPPAVRARQGSRRLQLRQPGVCRRLDKASLDHAKLAGRFDIPLGYREAVGCRGPTVETLSTSENRLIPVSNRVSLSEPSSNWFIKLRPTI